MSRGGFWSVAFAVGWRNAHNFFTKPSMIVPAVMFPLFFFTAFAGGLSRVDSIPGFDYGAGYTTFVYGFVLLQASAFGGVFPGFSIAADFESGFARRMMLAAPDRRGILLYWGGLLLERRHDRRRLLSVRRGGGGHNPPKLLARPVCGGFSRPGTHNPPSFSGEALSGGLSAPRGRPRTHGQAAPDGYA